MQQEFYGMSAIDEELDRAVKEKMFAISQKS